MDKVAKMALPVALDVDASIQINKIDGSCRRLEANEFPASSSWYWVIIIHVGNLNKVLEYIVYSNNTEEVRVYTILDDDTCTLMLRCSFIELLYFLCYCV